MSAPLNKFVQNPYAAYVAYCKSCIAECRQCLTTSSPEEACHDELEDAIRSLTRAVEVMLANSRFATRYLVDCADVCAVCAERCESFANEACRRAAKACREAVLVCRRGSLV